MPFAIKFENPNVCQPSKIVKTIIFYKFLSIKSGLIQFWNSCLMIEYLLVSIEGDHIQDHRRVPTYGNSLKYEKETNHTPNLVQFANLF